MFSSETDRLVELCYSFLSYFFIFYILYPYFSIPRILGYDAHGPVLLGLSLYSHPSICTSMVFPPLYNSDQAIA